MLQSIFCLQLNNARVSLLLTPKLLYTLKPYIKKMGKFNKELSRFILILIYPIGIIKAQRKIINEVMLC